jgi:bifunctional NMN adenylyltransferase/nudix hydrolase
MNVTAVIIARFQTPYLHEGHRYLLDGIKARHHKVIVVLGVSPVKGSKRNPFDFYTREKLLKTTYPEFVILPLADHPFDEVWSANLDELLLNTFPNEEFILYGSRDSFIPYYSGYLHAQELPERGDHSATVIRNEYADKVMESKDFRLGINYAYHNMYSKVYPTIDVAVFKENRSYVLLGRKKNRKEWRLPGGFVDVNDKDYESAALRELHEECGDIETGPMCYVGSAKIDDWRYRNEEDKIMTLLFAADLVYGHVTANDDLQEVKWFEVKKLGEMVANNMIAREHQGLIELLRTKWITKETKLFTQNFDV